MSTPREICSGELSIILKKHRGPEYDPWSLLLKLGVSQDQVHRLQMAYDDISIVAALPGAVLTQLCQEYALSPLEWARIQASLEADMFLRLLLYHNYPLAEAANKANAIYAAAIRDKIATGGKGESIFPALAEHDAARIDPGPTFHHPRGPRPQNNEID